MLYNFPKATLIDSRIPQISNKYCLILTSFSQSYTILSYTFVYAIPRCAGPKEGASLSSRVSMCVHFRLSMWLALFFLLFCFWHNSWTAGHCLDGACILINHTCATYSTDAVLQQSRDASAERVIDRVLLDSGERLLETSGVLSELWGRRCGWGAGSGRLMPALLSFFGLALQSLHSTSFLESFSGVGCPLSIMCG